MSNDELFPKIILEILCQDVALAALDPAPAVGEDEVERPAANLIVDCEFQGRSIEVVDDYSVTITLSRPFRDEATDRNDFENLWTRVKQQIQDWISILPSIESIGKISHLTIDQIEQSGQPAIDDDSISRWLTFDAYFAQVP